MKGHSFIEPIVVGLIIGILIAWAGIDLDRMVYKTIIEGASTIETENSFYIIPKPLRLYIDENGEATIRLEVFRERN